ncbi:hypothetical protein FACS1894153_2350 [Bacteroidia bacterium]|nr:hypothetical protein FACS1894153_2350 [Bacteroidia bacterium]
MRDECNATEEVIRGILSQQLNIDKNILSMPTGNIMLEVIKHDPLHLFNNVLNDLQNLNNGEKPTDENGYISINGRYIITFESPYGASESGKNQELLDFIEFLMQKIQEQYPNVEISSFGAPIIAVENANRIKADSIFAISISVILIIVLLVCVFKKTRNILLLLVSVVFGWLFALSILGLFRENISLIAVGISSIFIGIAINYPLHYLMHLKHQPNPKLAIKEIIKPLLTGNITTVAAFLSLTFIDSKAMADLGLFGASLLIGTIFFTVVFLPLFIPSSLSCPISNISNNEYSRSAKLSKSYKYVYNKYLFLFIFIATIFLAYFSGFTKFDTNMNNINYMTPQQRFDMNELMMFANKNTPISNKKTSTNSVNLSVEMQKQNIEKWNRYRNVLLGIENDFLRQSQNIGFSPNAFDPFLTLIHTDFVVQPKEYFTPVKHIFDIYVGSTDTTVTDSVGNVQKNFSEMMVETLSDDFNTVLYFCAIIVFIFLIISFRKLEYAIIAFLPLFISWIWILGLMYLFGIQFNIVNIILATFIFGQGDDYTIFITEGLINKDLREKQRDDIDLAETTDIKTDVIRKAPMFTKSIIVSALLMFIGIGTLIFSQHPAMKSLAEVTIVGMLCVVLMSLIIPPMIFNFLTKNGKRKQPVTIVQLLTGILALTGFVVGCLFLILSCFVIFLFFKKDTAKLLYHKLLHKVAKFVIYHIPFAKYHLKNISAEKFDKPSIIISNHQSHLDIMAMMALTPKLIIFTNDRAWNNLFYGWLIRRADFMPSSNFLSATQCADLAGNTSLNNLEKIKELVANGYSVMLFPEGTRSVDDSISRFHKGAFFLAQQLNLDIVPIVLQGFGKVLPKKDFMLFKGSLHATIYHRIQIQNFEVEQSATKAATIQHSSNFIAVAKKMRQWYKAKISNNIFD